MTKQTCENCIYHTYITGYTGKCRIYNRLVASIEICDCEEWEKSNQESIIRVENEVEKWKT